MADGIGGDAAAAGPGAVADGDPVRDGDRCRAAREAEADARAEAAIAADEADEAEAAELADADAEATAGDAAGGAGTLPASYMSTPVDWIAPGSRAMLCTVASLPSVSVSRTVNGPGPAPDGAIQ